LREKRHRKHKCDYCSRSYECDFLVQGKDGRRLWLWLGRGCLWLWLGRGGIFAGVLLILRLGFCVFFLS